MNQEQKIIEDADKSINEMGLSLDDKLTIHLEQKRFFGLLESKFIEVTGRFIESGAEVLANSDFCMSVGLVSTIVARDKKNIIIYGVSEFERHRNRFYGKVYMKQKIKPSSEDFSDFNKYLCEVRL
ncbi:MAG: hypothetical protein AABW67_02195 [Nanoarchaeota archaeon]